MKMRTCQGKINWHIDDLARLHVVMELSQLRVDFLHDLWGDTRLPNQLVEGVLLLYLVRKAALNDPLLGHFFACTGFYC